MQNGDWRLIEAIARKEEQPKISPEHYLVSTEEQQSTTQEINVQIRGSAASTEC
jgi:hypothetical protein